MPTTFSTYSSQEEASSSSDVEKFRVDVTTACQAAASSLQKPDTLGKDHVSLGLETGELCW